MANTIEALKHYFKRSIWSVSSQEKVLYLTFDDGPIPTITPWILDQLKQYDAKATFFCVGENIEKHKTIFDRILTENHAVGNHTYNHIHGWESNNASYYDDVKACDKLIQSKLFRPPFASLTVSQLIKVAREYKIAMWDITSHDFDASFTTQNCLDMIIPYTRQGSILLFHDNIKSTKNLMNILPLVLQYYSEKGYQFKALTSDLVKQNALTHLLLILRLFKYPLFKLRKRHK